MIDAINVNKLSKNYGTYEVLKGIEFNVKQGEIFALLGINGAGKTTTLEIIEGLRKYDSGTITVNGKIGHPPYLHILNQWKQSNFLQNGIKKKLIMRC